LPPEKECPDWRDWRRERNCRQTLSAAFSITYEPHKWRWMLTRESWGCCRDLQALPQRAGRAGLDPDMNKT
jgi:hypothetical protein